MLFDDCERSDAGSRPSTFGLEVQGLDSLVVQRLSPAKQRQSRVEVQVVDVNLEVPSGRQQHQRRPSLNTSLAEAARLRA